MKQQKIIKVKPFHGTLLIIKFTRTGAGFFFKKNELLLICNIYRNFTFTILKLFPLSLCDSQA